MFESLIERVMHSISSATMMIGSEAVLSIKKPGTLRRMKIKHAPSIMRRRPMMSETLPAASTMKMYASSAISVASWASPAFTPAYCVR